MILRRTLGLLGLGLIGCGPVHFLVAANRSVSQFMASPSDVRVFYEPGAEARARAVAAAMPSAVAVVEQRMFSPFTSPVRVYVCASINSLTSYGASARAGGFTVNHRVFISPKSENTAERIPHILAHELSHLHLGQKRGLISFATMPVWFVEGLAVDVSDGGGAESVTEVDAWRAILKGHALDPDTDGSVWHRRGASAFGLGEHMFYRQAGMFVSYMRSMDGARFRTFLAAVEDGDPIEDALREAYGMGTETMWRRFRAGAVRGIIVSETERDTILAAKDAAPWSADTNGPFWRP